MPANQKVGKTWREQVCHTPPARTANPSLLTYILARGTLAAAMRPIRALASSTTPLSIHLSPTLALALALALTITLTSSDGHWHTSQRRPRARHGAPKTRGRSEAEREAREWYGLRRVASGGR